MERHIDANTTTVQWGTAPDSMVLDFGLHLLNCCFNICQIGQEPKKEP